MATISDIVETVKSYSPDADFSNVMAAYLIAAKAHAGQTRKSGEAYLTHPLAVAMILADMRMDTETIATALLHDALEDNPITKAEMEAQIGPEITALVDGVTKIGKLRFRSKDELAAENFRKMMLAMSRDLRVILVKLADRTHNMRTIEHHSPPKRRLVASETMEIFVPIANRLGLTRIKNELEDICLSALHPEEYGEILDYLEGTQADRAAYITQTTVELERRLSADGLSVKVSGRAKHPASIFRKMEDQGLKVHEVHDIIAFRVIVRDVGSCYATLGLIHSYFPPIPDRIKDYIARPKPNGYQSLHTTVIGPGERRMEVQIRTPEMHRINEEGVAAHWRYKEGKLALSRDDVAKISRIRDVFEHADEHDDASDFMEALKCEFYADEVFVFTPAGDIRTFPVGASTLDFAYAVHTEVGNQCTGAKVNGRMVPLRYALKSGDSVEILTSPNQKPNRGWLEIVKTGRAIQKIRRVLREEERELGVRLGREMLEAELKRLNTSLSKIKGEGGLNKVLQEHGLSSVDDLFQELARGRLTVAEVAQKLLPEGAWRPRHESTSNPLTAVFGRWGGKRTESPVLIGEEDGVMVHFAKCCAPLPGEPISGFITRGRGITVHRADCGELERLDTERRIAVQWDPGQRHRHHSEVQLICTDRPGLLADISKVCEQAKVNISRAEAHSLDEERAVCTLLLSVRDVEEMTTLSVNLRKVRGVEEVHRIQQRA
ncbi:MAG: bifunctional (p)ppGpp synthetase/guanosine-3',5'-bis(diphosphate) 3'-pyrophosphohydrolase [Deltaproteobacteria bacterium]|nr:MAG: bifunctional (p)ppGpp synthetase/guanosine-3',5'-bis(diphosphate) 3'-pyrophosphohydrolase [Deltaproteobacteria bacterium]